MDSRWIAENRSREPFERVVRNREPFETESVRESRSTQRAVADVPPLLLLLLLLLRLL